MIISFAFQRANLLPFPPFCKLQSFSQRVDFIFFLSLFFCRLQQDRLLPCIAFIQSGKVIKGLKVRLNEFDSKKKLRFTWNYLVSFSYVTTRTSFHVFLFLTPWALRFIISTSHSTMVWIFYRCVITLCYFYLLTLLILAVLLSKKFARFVISSVGLKININWQ